MISKIFKNVLDGVQPIMLEDVFKLDYDQLDMLQVFFDEFNSQRFDLYNRREEHVKQFFKESASETRKWRFRRSYLSIVRDSKRHQIAVLHFLDFYGWWSMADWMLFTHPNKKNEKQFSDSVDQLHKANQKAFDQFYSSIKQRGISQYPGYKHYVNWNQMETKLRRKAFKRFSIPPLFVSLLENSPDFEKRKHVAKMFRTVYDRLSKEVDLYQKLVNLME